LQRIWALALTLVFSFELLMPLLSAEPESKLPACCRRDGKHACSMMMKSSPSSIPGKPSISAKKIACPLYPSGKTLPVSARAAGTPVQPTSWIPANSTINVVEQLEARFRMSFSRATQKRGPPPTPAA
jgi:hypothetical protein